METILLVDDDIHVVTALQRRLHKNYQVEIASCAADAMEAIAGTSYAVVVSDLKMPGMNGIEFLGKVKETSPETVRILLTGQADLGVAIAAVNEGSVFRFLTKPCPDELLTKTLDAALDQHRLVVGERDVLQETLSSTVGVLAEILAVIQPAAFGRAWRASRHVQTIAREMKLPDLWQFEVAAMLSQIGCISVDPAVLRKYDAGELLSAAETAQMLSQAQVGQTLLEKIPRLHAVAEMIGRQHDVSFGTGSLPGNHVIELGAQLLHVALDFDRLTSIGRSAAEALNEMRRSAQYSPDMLVALDREQHEAKPDAATEVPDREPSEVERQLFRPIAEQVLRSLTDE
ncbi:MAG: HD domain-containing phosphohydrolase [Bryobacteraceae bacterium]|jgi:response regulator RpfG family c-di-GMP phosphodiesterase